ncbi:TPA: miniconductance mechanosensitive channel MscM [Photobacterium damselae]
MLGRRLFVLVCLMFTMLVTAPVHANENEQTLNDKIEYLNKQPQTPETIKELDIYLQAQNQVAKAKEFNRLTKQYDDLIDTFPKQVAALQNKIDAFSTSEFPEFNQWDKEQLTLEIAEQDNLLLQLESSRNAHKNILLEIERGIDNFTAQSDRLRRQLKSTELDLQQARRINDTNALLLLQINEQYLNSYLNMLEAEQLSSGNRRTLAKLQVQYDNQEIEARQAYRNNLQSTLNRVLRMASSDNQETGTELEESMSDQPLVIQQLLQANQRLSGELNNLNYQNEQTQQQAVTANKQISEVTKTADDLNAMTDLLKLSPAFSESMRNRIKGLPSNPPIEALDNSIGRNQLKKYEYQQQVDSLSQRQKHITSSGLTPEQQVMAKELSDANIGLYSDLIAASESLIYQQAVLKVAYDKLNTKLTDLKNLAAKRLFWAPDTNPLSVNLLIDTWEKLKWFFSPSQWVNLLKAPMVINHFILLTIIVVSGLLISGQIWARKRWKKYLEKTSAKIGRVTMDKFRYSYINVCVAFCFAWVIPLVITLFGYGLQEAWQYPFVHHLGQAIVYPMALVVFFFIRELVRKNGLFISHFGWDDFVVNPTFAHYRRLLWIYIPMMVIQNFALNYSDIEVNGTLGRLAFIISNCALSYFHYRMWQQKLPMTYGDVPEGKAHLGHHLFWWTLILVPQILNYSALNGYLGSSQAIMLRMEQSAVLGVVTMLIYYLCKRLMLIQKRRLAFERAKAKRQEIIAQRQAEVQGDKEENFSTSEINIEIEEPEIDLDKISAQSLRLLRSLLLLIYLAMMAWLLSDLYLATSSLQNVTLWDVTSKINGIDQLSAITLNSVLLAVLTFGLTTILARDLPAAMELLILQHLDLRPGTGYAITSLTRYFAIFIGIIVGSGLIGFDWSKMQWLVAALGVGIGFGMQEIFANFISGLIILFEKPIRIGDTVTIRDLTGMVTKIQTRATTIVDWDRKEVIMPNKAFVTEQFVNWSLSDSITRVKLFINVEYVADPELVTQLLFDAAHECRLVLDDPAPEVFFLGLDANCQRFEVRAYAAETGHRLSLTHDLHCRIKNKFMDHSIMIAHPQLEVTMKKQELHPMRKSFRSRKA